MPCDLVLDPEWFPPVLRSEMQVRLGSTPGSIPQSVTLLGGLLDLNENEFLFRTPEGSARFHYRRGAALALQLEDSADASATEAYLQGTVLGAVAWLNGLLPLHASAVADGRRTIAFTADSGGGKSTLAAALGKRGYVPVADDTLILHVDDAGATAFPSARPLKLWQDAVAATGLSPDGEIAAQPGKFHVQAAHPVPSEPARLSDLVFLSWGERARIEPVTGAAKAALAPSAFYRPSIHAALANERRHARFITSLAGTVRFWRFIRPRDLAGLDRGLEPLLQMLRQPR